MSFSADTDMGECLVVGRKSVGGSARATFVILNKRPPFQMLGAGIATQIRCLVASKNMRRLEDGQVGGSPLYFGDDRVGYALDASLPPAGEWNPVRIADLSIAQSAYQTITHHRLWLPNMNEADALPISITNVEGIGKIGPYHADSNRKQPDGEHPRTVRRRASEARRRADLPRDLGTLRGELAVNLLSGREPRHPTEEQIEARANNH